MREPAFYPEVQYKEKIKEHLMSGKIINSLPLINNKQMISTPYKHFTPEQRNELSILIRAKIKKKKIAKLLKKDGATI